jgi:hypothetical protein
MMRTFPDYKPGLTLHCNRCGGEHVVEQPYDRTTTERIHLYVTCRGRRFFVGQVAPTPRD